MDPISVAAWRGAVVESRHRVHAVAARGGVVVTAAGDPGLVTFMRSAAKPFQALLLVRARPDLEQRDLAIAAASHEASPAQLEAVRALLAKAGAGEDELECGSQEGKPPGPIGHNCSGKHAGMLAVCRARGWGSRGYRLPDHPLQREVRAELARAAGLPEGELSGATDGCGVVTFALPLERMALAFSRLEAGPDGARIAAAMRAYPELVGGEGIDDTVLMRALPGWTAKRGAEGLLCAAGPDGLGVAVKAEDGSSRALLPALVFFLGGLGSPCEELARIPIGNSRGERVGELAVER